MGECEADSALSSGLAKALARIGIGAPGGLVRLTGGATMESWRFSVDGDAYVLRRAPSEAFLEGRPYGHATEAAIIAAAHAAGVRAPEVVLVLDEDDGIGSGFVMRALPGTPDPRAILAMEGAVAILEDAARDLALIHAIPASALPGDVPALDPREGIAGLRSQFIEAGGDRPGIALGLRWLEDHCPTPIAPVLNHGDFRLGNLLAADGCLTGVLDWELAHFGDYHEDLAFGCMPVWRFGAYDRPALGLGSLEAYFRAYEQASGRRVDPARFRFWSVYRTVWWALGCLRNARMWREAHDRMLERVVISRRTSEQELDLLMLLEEEAPGAERERPLDQPLTIGPACGEADVGEIATAVSEWLATLKDKLSGHDRFQLAVARNALGIAARADHSFEMLTRDVDFAADLLNGQVTLQTEGVLARLRRDVLAKLAVDVPKYPSLAVARRKWTGED